jgi:hypothetical protein
MDNVVAQEGSSMLPGNIIAHGEDEEDEKPEKPRAGKHPCHLRAVPDMHKEQNNEDSLDDSDGHGNNNIERAQVDIRHRDGKHQEHKQHHSHPQICPFGNDHRRSAMNVNEVEKGIQENPDNIHEMPVEPEHLHGGIVFGCEPPPPL